MDRLPPLPAPPSPPPRTSFPIIAVIAPAVGAIVVATVTGSLFVLVFAALSPIIAVATALDARRSARRHRRDEAARFDRDCASWLARVPELHARERAIADATHPPARELAAASAPLDRAAPLRLGTAPAESDVLAEGPPSAVDDAAGARLAELASEARTHPALPVVVAPGPIVVLGRGAVAESIARAIELHPGCIVLRDRPPAEHGETPLAVLRVESPTRAVLREASGAERCIRPEGLSRRELDAALERRARDRPALPDAVAWSALARAAAGTGEPIAPGTVGVAASGPLSLDLLGESPHALVGGTTGSGKSELLRTLALSWAVGAPPTVRSILLVDFKGGSSFAELASLPHVVGVITDLDASAAGRALRSLRAELRRREALLLAHGRRDIRELAVGALSRLLVLVDEYAALVEAFPELQPVIADLAARGRSLGIHLVLCTQRPAGVVRDAIAANCGTRVAFRLTSASDATGLLPGGAPPPADAPPGRAVVAAAGRTVELQVATIAGADVSAIAARWAEADPPPRPWLPPLPARVLAAELATLAPADASPSMPSASVVAPSLPAHGAETPLEVPFGMLDDPDRQRRALAAWRPARDGALLVVGAPGSGATEALAALAHGAMSEGARAIVLPADLADALGALDELRDEIEAAPATAVSPRRPIVLVVPEIDALTAEAGEAALDLMDGLDAIVRRLRRGGGGLVASAQAVLRARSGVIGRFDSILLLRATSLDDHRAAGGAPEAYDPDAPLGRGRWQGKDVQVAIAPTPLPTSSRPLVEPWCPDAGTTIAVVSGRPAVTARALAARGWRVALEPTALEARGASPVDADRTDAASAPRAVIADAETWQASWAALARVRREGTIVLADATEADARLVLGPRARVPLRADHQEEIIVVAAGETPRRARWSGPVEDDAGVARRRSG